MLCTASILLLLVLLRSTKEFLIIDLIKLNRFIPDQKFRMFTVAQVRLHLWQNAWLTALLDLKDAYWHVKINRRYRRYLAFQVGDATYQLAVAPFGLCLAPRFFTKLTNPITASFIDRGIDPYST